MLNSMVQQEKDTRHEGYGLCQLSYFFVSFYLTSALLNTLRFNPAGLDSATKSTLHSGQPINMKEVESHTTVVPRSSCQIFKGL